MYELNLLPDFLREKKQKKIQSRKYFVAGFCIFCVMFLLVCFPILKSIKVQSNEQKYKKQVEKLNIDTLITRNENIKNEIESYNQYINKVEYLSKNKILVSQKIRELEQYVPADIVFNNLTCGEDELIINGTAKSLSSISNFAANIQISGKYKDVRIGSVTMESQAAGSDNSVGNVYYRFTISAN